MWMYLKGILLGERNQSQKITYYTILFIWNYQKEKTTEMDKETSGCPKLGAGRE